MGELVTETFPYDGGRDVSAYVPDEPPEALVVAGDGQLLAPWGADLAVTGPPTLLVGVHRADDEERRLQEYSPGFDPDRFAAHEALVLDLVRRWVPDRFGLIAPRARTAAYGVSAGGELALALGVRHPELFGAVLAASPGAGYRPDALPAVLPRAYLVAGDDEPFFRDNAARWAAALAAAGGEVVLQKRAGGHGGAFWRAELPLMLGWAFSG